MVLPSWLEATETPWRQKKSEEGKPRADFPAVPGSSIFPLAAGLIIQLLGKSCPAKRNELATQRLSSDSILFTEKKIYLHIRIQLLVQNQVFGLCSLHTNWVFHATSKTWMWLSEPHVFCFALSCPVCKAAIPTGATHPLLTVGIFTSHSPSHPKCHQSEGQVRHFHQRNNNLSVFQACLSFKIQPKWLWHDPVESHSSSDYLLLFHKGLDPSLSAKENTPAGASADQQTGSSEFWDQGENPWHCKLKVKQISLGYHAGLKIIKWTGNRSVPSKILFWPLIIAKGLRAWMI